MAKASRKPDLPKTEPKVALDDAGSAPAGSPGVHEVPASQPEQIGVTPDPATYLLPPAEKLTEGQIGGLGREALEAYWYGARTRHDRADRLWEFRREAVAGLWSLTIRVTIGPMLLAEASIPLDRLPSADGEHEVLKLVENLSMVAQQRHEAARKEQAHALKPEGD